MKELLDNFKTEMLEKFQDQDERIAEQEERILTQEEKNVEQDVKIARQSETISQLEKMIAEQQKTIEEQNETIQMIAIKSGTLREDSLFFITGGYSNYGHGWNPNFVLTSTEV